MLPGHTHTEERTRANRISCTRSQAEKSVNKRDDSLLTAAAVTSGQLRSWCSLRAISTSTRELAFVTLLARSVRIRCGESVARSRLVLSGFGPRLRFQIELDFGGRCEAEGLGNFLEVK